ncbi:Lysophospholipase, alpha-beta hydrolase superfamily [Variovorax sp. HW608]|uniref:alpha/beta hydrolase n=1 Tax=Variovorax sp. HW608 TaxID=1034889 RepID=UPI00081FEDE0|nr:alpha/beta hydrolase [Variovorax sp. HW608]SCK56145.1 Lysophospholipase, alpha-beta hydrolase superfamily [Variovorax sp. HW608]
MVSRLLKFLKWTALVLVIMLITAIALRTYDVQRGPPLERWHTFVPHELSQGELRKADWAAYIAAENKAFDEVRAQVTDKLPPEAQLPGNRYFKDSPIYPGRFAQDWNRSYLLEPEGAARGAVVLLHGLTDSPYSLRHVAGLYRDRGFVVVAIRMPGHGTVPSGLTKVDWEDWSEATRLAVREARRRAPAPLPLHVVGFSNGGALAMKYALDGLDDRNLARPDRVILIAPMIGITELSRFAGVFGWPAIFPAFAKAAWLGIVPEFNPFKYNSFPVNGARQSSLLTRDLRAHIAREESAGNLARLPPILTFQSLIDFTVSTRAIVTGLYARLPANGSELVLFDLNRSIKFGPLLRSGSDLRLDRILPAAPRNFRSTIITNTGPDSRQVLERVTEAGATSEKTRTLDLEFPLEVFSLSHLALPFPMNDSLYGMRPDNTDEFGVNLGALAMRGERGALIVSLDSLSRLSSNPFYPYMAERIGGVIPKAQP